MRRVVKSLAAVVALMAAAAVLPAGPAQADARTGYAVDDGVVVTITGATLVGGNVVSVRVTASRTVDGVRVPVTCNVLRVSTTPDLVESFVGGGASTFDLQLDTLAVPRRTPTVITATCEYSPFGTGGGTATASNIITLLPLGGDDGDAGSGVLPRTGAGAEAGLLAIGALLVVGGGVVVGRRRQA